MLEKNFSEEISQEMLIQAKELQNDFTKFENFLVNHIRDPIKYDEKILILAFLVTEKSNIPKLDSVINEVNKSAFPNIKNFKKVIEWIRENDWEKNWRNEYIHSASFKEICKTPIVIPSKSNIIQGIFSGEYILNLLHKHDSTEGGIKLEWTLNLKNNVTEDYSRKVTTFFYSKGCYLDQFEKRLNISLELLKIEGQKKGTLLWDKVFESYAYAVNDLNDCPNSKNRILTLFDVPYILNFGGGNISNSKHILEIPEVFNGFILFKTMMFQNMNEKFKSKFLVLYSDLSEIITTLSMTVVVIFMQFNKLAESCVNLLEKFLIISEFQNELRNKIQNMPTLDEKLTGSVDTIYATEGNVFDIIFCRMNWYEIKNFYDIFENALIVDPKVYDKYDQVTLFREINSNETVSVNTWSEFKEKYNLYLKSFFPEVSDLDQLKKYWHTTAKLFCYLPFTPLDENKLSNQPRNPENSICKIGTKIFFATMFFVVNSENYYVKKSGKGTKFYRRIIDSNKNFDNKKMFTLYSVLRTIKTHYYSSKRPYFYLVLSMQILWWSAEQYYSFMIPKNILKLTRKFIENVLNRCEIIMRVNDFDESLKSAENLKNYLNEPPFKILRKI